MYNNWIASLSPKLWLICVFLLNTKTVWSIHYFVIKYQTGIENQIKFACIFKLNKYTFLYDVLTTTCGSLEKMTNSRPPF